MSAKFQKMFLTSYIILRTLGLGANSVDPDEVAHYEPPHLDLCCLQMQLFSFSGAFWAKSLLTLKVPNKNFSRRHFNFLLLSFEENKA